MQEAVLKAVRKSGIPDYVVLSAGSSRPGYFLQQQVEVFRHAMELNYLGIVISLKSVLPFLLQRGKGHILFVSSAAGVSGWIGYSSYVPTKFAVRGLADCLRQEFLGCNIRISIAYPPDTFISSPPHISVY
jgi:3-dehydrosphinganine reductase